MNDEQEQKIIDSFQLVKSDMKKLATSLSLVLDKVEKLDSENKKLNLVVSKVKPTVVVSRKTAAKVSKKFVASKTGKKVHMANCMHARNIKKRVIFKSKTDALNKGYKLCSCVAY